MQSVDSDVICIYLVGPASSSGERGLLSSGGSGLSCCRARALGARGFVAVASEPGSVAVVAQA